MQGKFVAGEDPHNGKWPGYREGLVEIKDGMEIRWDVPVLMRDGVTRIFVDIFRPADSLDEPLPVLFTWSPYGKHGPKTLALFPDSGVPEGSVSSYAVWEGPDPLYWCKQGYAIVNGDCRGSWGSDGDVTYHSPQQAEDGYDVIEWIAAQPWSNGKVGMAGVSYLATAQYGVAALNPPHLACINPWEGWSDFYRERAFHGGIPETKFFNFTQWSIRCSYGMVENLLDIYKEHPLLDAYNQSKSARLSDIKVPAYFVVDWGDHGIHTRGTIQAYLDASSKEKWLEVHGGRKWQYYYQQSSLDRQKAFYDRYLLDKENEVKEWAPVRIEVRDGYLEGTFRDEREWPLARTRYERLYLDAEKLELSPVLPSSNGLASYDSESPRDPVVFTHTFAEETELTGYMRLRLWVSAPDADDLDIFVQLDKLDPSGKPAHFVAFSITDKGPMALGWLRASHRTLDLERTTDHQPWHTHQKVLKLAPGEIVPVDIEIWPSSTRFRPGETLAVSIQGQDIFRHEAKQSAGHESLVNKGINRIHTGPNFESYLVIPVVK